MKLQDEELIVHLEEVLHQKRKQDANENKAKANKAISKDLDIWAAIKPVKKSYAN